MSVARFKLYHRGPPMDMQANLKHLESFPGVTVVALYPLRDAVEVDVENFAFFIYWVMPRVKWFGVLLKTIADPT